jgi:Domain of unknown function (DUF4832)/Beta-galactosidase
VHPAEKSGISDDVRLELAEGIRQMLNRSMRALLHSSLAFAVVMLQGVWSLAGGLDAMAHDDSAQAEPTVTVHPKEINDVLYNPGMGLADFHFGFEHPPSTDQYPRQTVAYFRWSWSDLEPEEGLYAFDFVDRIISQAKAKGETLAFRIMTEYKAGSPAWLLHKGVGSVTVGGGVFPDYNNPTFLMYHEKLIKAFGKRYAGSPDIDHVDIGSVGCWGEWNMACCQGVEAQCKQYFPVEENQIKITEWYLQYFSGTPLVMLHGGQLTYAVSRGAGWRGDCFGDYGFFSPTWNHMDHAYTRVLQDPVIENAWKNAPVQFEVCGVMQDWYEKGFDIDLILKNGLEWHVSVLNAKSSPIPTEWRPRVDEFLTKIGYRFVLRQMTHATEAKPDRKLSLRSRWENVGVAPIYHDWPLAYRLRSAEDHVVARWASAVHLRQWLPGVQHEVEDSVTLPEDVPEGSYVLDVAILDQGGHVPFVDLAISGKRQDRWYPISTVIFRR